METPQFPWLRDVELGSWQQGPNALERIAMRVPKRTRGMAVLLLLLLENNNNFSL